MDARLSASESIGWLTQRGYDWISVQRGREPPPKRATDAVFRTRRAQREPALGSHPPRWTRKTRSAWTAARSRQPRPGARNCACVWSLPWQAKDDAILARRGQAFEATVCALHTGLSAQGQTKRYEKVLVRLGRVKVRDPQVAKPSKVKVLRVEDGAWVETGQNAEALGEPPRLHRRRVRIPAPFMGEATGPLFGPSSPSRKDNPVMT